MDVLIVGASARAAAYSARRAGLIPAAIDLFADEDLRQIATVTRVDRADYPDGIALAAAGMPPGPWIYTGAIENHPDLVDRLARTRPLWGNTAETLRAVRDPFQLASILARHDLPCPRVRAHPYGLPRDGSWLIKPCRSGGGRAITPLVQGRDRLDEPCYYQEQVAGVPLSAVFLGSEQGAELIGVAWQWVGRDDRPFAYVGNIAPWPLEEDERKRIEQLGRALAAEFGLRGLFGIDFQQRDGVPWLIEVNPRYTASVELFELTTGRALLGEHRAIFNTESAKPARSHAAAATATVVGKAIVYANAPCRFPAHARNRCDPARLNAVSPIADIPAPGARFNPGDPVLTVFARGRTVDQCRARLERSVARWHARLEADDVPADAHSGRSPARRPQ